MTPQIKQRIEQIRRGEVPEGYKKTKAGVIPSSWATFSLGDIYTERKETGIPFLPILTVSIHSGVSDGALDEDELSKKVKRIEDKTQYRTARAGDVVFNMMRAWQGAIGVVRQDGLVSPAYIVATPNEAVNPPFMDYCLKSPKMINRLHRKSYGVTDFRLRLYWDSFSKVDCVLPPLAEQEKIAAILQTQDKLIELQQMKIDELKKLKKVYLSKMFPKKGCNVPEIRFPGFTAPWKQRKLGEMGSTFTGLSGKTKEDFGHGDAKFITYMNVFSNPIADLQMTETVEIDSKQNCVKAGDVFFTTSSETPEEVGMSCVMPENADNTYLNSFCFGYRPTERFDLNYLAYVLRSESFRKEMTFLAQGISRYNISKNKVMEVEIPVPSLDEQSKIGRYFANLDNLITLHQRKCEEQKKYKKALMQILLTGIVRVTL